MKFTLACFINYIWALTQEDLSLGLPIRPYENQPAQLQRLARVVEFHLQQVFMTLPDKQITKGTDPETHFLASRPIWNDHL